MLKYGFSYHMFDAVGALAFSSSMFPKLTHCEASGSKITF